MSTYTEQTELVCTHCGEGFPSLDMIESWYGDLYCSVNHLEFDLENGRGE